MKQTFQAGVDAIYNAIVGQGTTPAGKTPADMATAIGTMATNKYNAGMAAATPVTKNWRKIGGPTVSGTSLSYTFSGSYELALVIGTGKGSDPVTACLGGVSASSYRALGSSGSYYVSSYAVLINRPVSGNSVSFYLTKQGDRDGNNMIIDVYVV